MNKLLVDSSNDKIAGGTYDLEFLDDQEVIIYGDNYLINIDRDNRNLDLNILDDSETVFYKANVVSKDTTLNICTHDRCRFELNLLLLNMGNNTFTLNVNMIDSDSICKIKARVLNKGNDKIHFICNGKILESTFNNELIEDLKGLITSSDEIKISPNIEALTSELNANHLVTIGSFSKEELFYLNSKGLSERVAKKMLTESFISQVTNEALKEKIKTEVITIE